MHRVLFVCTGNICRSPTAHGVFRKLVTDAGLAGQVMCDSAGLIGYHAGEPPDRRSSAAARSRGYVIDDLRARQFDAGDFEQFDLILAMDRGHLQELSRMAPAGSEGRVKLFLDLVPGLQGRDVPDPYYGGRDGFERVLDLIERGARSLISRITGSLPQTMP